MDNREVATCLDKTLGYLYFLDKSHPLANQMGKVYHHRHVASVKLGRWLEKSEIVHHIDGDRANNDPENLAVMTLSEHGRYHHPQREPIACGVCGETTFNKAYCSVKCCLIGRRVMDRPTKEQLVNDLSASPWVRVGRKYGVSDNAVRKWARSYGLL